MLKTLLSWAPALLLDAVGLAGGGAIVFGVSMIYPPAAWIVGGAMGLGVAALVATR